MHSERLQKYLDEYSQSHQNKINLIIHKICIPLIVFHFFAMFTWVYLFTVGNYSVTLAEAVGVFLFAFYLFLDVKYAFCMGFFIALCIFVGHFTPVWCVWTIATLAWTAQLMGHAVWEKKSPAFSKNFIQLLIGPLFVLGMVV